LKKPTFLGLVANDLALVEQKMREPDRDRHPAVDDAVAHLIDSGGKRVRPIVVLLVCKLLQADCERGMYLAAAVEMLHTATLVHDDIIDGSLIRRGNPTLNATWSPGATILTGDYLFARAADMAARTDNVTVMRLFAHALMTICNGELGQIFSAQTKSTSRDEYYRRIYAKTGALFVLAAEAAGVLAGDEDEVRAHLRTFGKELGVAFQIVDDVLDFVGSETQVGKPLGSDLSQGLVTLPTICFLDKYADDERVLDVLHGRRSPKYVQLALEAVRNSDAIDLAKEEAKEHARLAQVALGNLPDNLYRQALLELADYTVQRNL
jgi:geranylgeranyl pyrophosphate synthase